MLANGLAQPPARAALTADASTLVDPLSPRSARFLPVALIRQR
jgi:hypothetical protein